MGSYNFATADKFGKNGWPFFCPLVLEFDSFLTLSRLDLAPWQKVDPATLPRALNFRHFQTLLEGSDTV